MCGAEMTFNMDATLQLTLAQLNKFRSGQKELKNNICTGQQELKTYTLAMSSELKTDKCDTHCHRG
jgi:hypothetical protein